MYSTSIYAAGFVVVGGAVDDAQLRFLSLSGEANKVTSSSSRRLVTTRNHRLRDVVTMVRSVGMVMVGAERVVFVVWAD